MMISHPPTITSGTTSDILTLLNLLLDPDQAKLTLEEFIRCRDQVMAEAEKRIAALERRAAELDARERKITEREVWPTRAYAMRSDKS